MSAGWMKKKAEMEKAGTPPPEEPPATPYTPPPLSLEDGKLSQLEWNFADVPDDELWPCLIWEYGRSAEWIHPTLPTRAGNLEERQAEMARFYAGQRSVAQGLLNKMRFWQWIWSNERGVQQIEFFPNSPWRTLPPIVRENMRRAVLGLEPLANLPLLHELLSPNASEGGDEKPEEILKALQVLAPPSDSEEELRFANHHAQWLSGGDGCDDVTEGVIRGEMFLRRVREALTKAAVGKLSPVEAQGLLDKTASGEISLGMLRKNKELTEIGYYAFALRINWRLKRKEILEKFGQMLDEAWPPGFRDRRAHGRAATRGPGGLELYISRGGKKAKCQPSTALSNLGNLRKVTAAGGISEAIALYHPKASGGRYDSQVSTYSRAVGETRSFFEQLFPKFQS